MEKSGGALAWRTWAKTAPNPQGDTAMRNTSLASPLKIVVGICLAACLTLCAVALSGCSQSAAAQSAQKIAFKAACADEYQAALDAVREQADDAKLIAIRTSAYAFEGSTPNWMYLFYSWKHANSYTVFVVDGTATVGETGKLSFTQDDFEAVPDVTGLAYDVDAAYKLLTESIEGDGKLATCRAYLMTFVEGDEDPTADAMKWFFSFNEPDDAADLKEDETTQESGATQDLEPRAFTVDASTGEVTELARSNAEEDAQDANPEDTPSKGNGAEDAESESVESEQ